MGGLESKSLSFPLYWYSLHHFKSRDVGAMVMSTLFHTQLMIQKHNLELDIDSFNWDGDSAISSFIKSFEVPNSNGTQFKIPLIPNKIFFTRDIGHKIKNQRNEDLNIYNKTPSKFHKHPHFPVRISKDKYELFEVKLIKLVKETVAMEKERGVTVSKWRDEDWNMNEVEKMNQKKCSKIFSSSGLRGAENGPLWYVLGKNLKHQSDIKLKKMKDEDEDEDEDEEMPLFDEFPRICEIEDIYDGEDSIKNDFSQQDMEKFFRYKNRNLSEVEKREHKIGMTLGEILSTMCYISFYTREYNIFKSKYAIKTKNDWRVLEAEKRIKFMKTYETHVEDWFSENYKTENWKYPRNYNKTIKGKKKKNDYKWTDFIHDREHLNKSLQNYTVLVELSKKRIDQGLSLRPIDTFSQDLCETHFSSIRHVSGLANAPTIVDYYYRMTHILLRSQYQLKLMMKESATYEYCPSAVADRRARKSMMSVEVLFLLNEYHEKMKSKVLDKLTRNMLPLLQNLEASKNLNIIMYRPQETYDIRRLTGYVIKEARRIYQQDSDGIIIDNMIIKRQLGRGRKETVPEYWILKIFLSFDSNLNCALSYGNVVLYQEIIELGCITYFLKDISHKIREKIEERINVDANDERMISIVRNMILRYIRTVVNHKFVEFNIMSKKGKKQFRKSEIFLKSVKYTSNE